MVWCDCTLCYCMCHIKSKHLSCSFLPSPLLFSFVPVYLFLTSPSPLLRTLHFHVFSSLSFSFLPSSSFTPSSHFQSPPRLFSFFPFSCRIFPSHLHSTLSSSLLLIFHFPSPICHTPFSPSHFPILSLHFPIFPLHFPTQLTTLENTPPEFLLAGTGARQAYSADTFPLGRYNPV